MNNAWLSRRKHGRDASRGPRRLTAKFLSSTRKWHPMGPPHGIHSSSEGNYSVSAVAELKTLTGVKQRCRKVLQLSTQENALGDKYC